jgi:NADPH2:quinone reductase
MKAVLMERPGGTEVLRFADVPTPQVRGAHDVLVRIRAAALNPTDYKTRTRGSASANGPIILGCDGAGVVEQVGQAVMRVRTGDEVFFLNGGFGTLPGTYAEYAIVDERYLVHKPRNLSFVEAAAVPLVFITAWEALFERTHAAPGKTVLIHAGLGGVGHVAIQLAKNAGARVATTVGSQASAEIAHQLGAEHAILYKQSDFVEETRRWSGGGAQIVFDTVGDETLIRSFDAVARYGDLVTCLRVSELPQSAQDAMWYENLRLSVVWMPAPQVFDWPEERIRQTGILEHAKTLIEAGTVKMRIAATFPLEQAAKAQDLLENGSPHGKVVLTMD